VKVVPSEEPTCLTRLLAESWLRTIARTLRLERNAAITAETPRFPVDPTTGTVSIAAFRGDEWIQGFGYSASFGDLMLCIYTRIQPWPFCLGKDTTKELRQR
jgi:hypothetical protein